LALFGKRNSSDGGTVEAPRPQPAPAAAAAAAAVAAAAAAAATSDVGRAPFPSAGLGAPLIPAPTVQVNRSPGIPVPAVPSATDARRSEAYYEVKGTIFGALIEAIDLAQLAKLDLESATSSTRSSRSRIS
jgi:pilus assembly protein CpaF